MAEGLEEGELSLDKVQHYLGKFSKLLNNFPLHDLYSILLALNASNNFSQLMSFLMYFCKKCSVEYIVNTGVLEKYLLSMLHCPEEYQQFLKTLKECKDINSDIIDGNIKVSFYDRYMMIGEGYKLFGNMNYLGEKLKSADANKLQEITKTLPEFSVTSQKNFNIACNTFKYAFINYVFANINFYNNAEIFHYVNTYLKTQKASAMANWLNTLLDSEFKSEQFLRNIDFFISRQKCNYISTRLDNGCYFALLFFANENVFDFALVTLENLDFLFEKRKNIEPELYLSVLLRLLNLLDDIALRKSIFNQITTLLCVELVESAWNEDAFIRLDEINIDGKDDFLREYFGDLVDDFKNNVVLKNINKQNIHAIIPHWNTLIKQADRFSNLIPLDEVNYPRTKKDLYILLTKRFISKNKNIDNIEQLRVFLNLQGDDNEEAWQSFISLALPMLTEQNAISRVSIREILLFNTIFRPSKDINAMNLRVVNGVT